MRQHISNPMKLYNYVTFQLPNLLDMAISSMLLRTGNVLRVARKIERGMLIMLALDAQKIIFTSKEWFYSYHHIE